MNLRNILEKAVELYNEPISDEEVDNAVMEMFGCHPEDIHPLNLYQLAYGTAITDLTARLGVDVKAFLESRGETQTIIDDGTGPSREEVETYASIYSAAQEQAEEEHRG